MDNNSKRLLSRAVYKSIKNMNREQLSDYVANVYIKGFEAGRKAGAPDALMRTFREVLVSIDSIGPTRADAIMKKIGDTYALKQTETTENYEEVTE
jgi:hypothetical protein